ncbi:MAG: pyruvate ferredoxin oxidoreductase [bacterium]|nr:MAG: pyruvate ferredoxin oxidoreductase [bacterium]
MSERVGIEVSMAAAEAVGRANVDVIPAYPITPQTHIVEHIAELVADGRLDAEYVPVESEHSAISAAVGAAAAGARTFTSTASQGLALMHEILFAASSMRLPIVMAVANRAISIPINIWADHSDIMPERDTGWVQLFAENGQDVFDLIIQAYRLAEDHRVLLPVIVNMDGFSLSHVIEPVILLDREEVDAFLPPIRPGRTLDPQKPRTMGAFGSPNVYTEVKKQQEDALIRASAVLEDIWREFETRFGRRYRAVETHKTDDAEIILVAMGSIAETAMTAVDEMREEGIRVGLARIRLWRPFPFEALFKALKGARVVTVLDRMLSPGGHGGPVGTELRSAYYQQEEKPLILDFIAGLGGRDISRETFRELVKRSLDGEPQSDFYSLLDVRVS